MKQYLARIAACAAALIFGVSARAEPLKVGDPAPAVTGVSDDGSPIKLADIYLHQPYTLVYFFPKAGTPGCTRQGCSLRDAYEKLQAKGVAVVGVSTDSVASQAKFKADQHFPFTLIADPDRTVINAFGVPTRSIPALGSIAQRQAFLIKEGKIVWADYHASTDKQASDVLKVLENQP